MPVLMERGEKSPLFLKMLSYLDLYGEIKMKKIVIRLSYDHARELGHLGAINKELSPKELFGSKDITTVNKAEIVSKVARNLLLDESLVNIENYEVTFDMKNKNVVITPK